MHTRIGNHHDNHISIRSDKYIHQPPENLLFKNLLDTDGKVDLFSLRISCASNTIIISYFHLMLNLQDPIKSLEYMAYYQSLRP